MVWIKSSENMVLEAISRLASLHDVLEQLLRGSCQERADTTQPAPDQPPPAAHGGPTPVVESQQEPCVLQQQPLDEQQGGAHAASAAGTAPLPIRSNDGDHPSWDQHGDEDTLNDASLLAMPPPGCPLNLLLD